MSGEQEMNQNVAKDMIQSKPTDNTARPNVYKGLITSCQQILADHAKMTDNIASAEMQKHHIGQNCDQCMGSDIEVMVNVSWPRLQK